MKTVASQNAFKALSKCLEPGEGILYFAQSAFPISKPVSPFFGPAVVLLAWVIGSGIGVVGGFVCHQLFTWILTTSASVKALLLIVSSPIFLLTAVYLLLLIPGLVVGSLRFLKEEVWSRQQEERTVSTTHFAITKTRFLVCRDGEVSTICGRQDIRTLLPNGDRLTVKSRGYGTYVMYVIRRDEV